MELNIDDVIAMILFCNMVATLMLSAVIAMMVLCYYSGMALDGWSRYCGAEVKTASCEVDNVCCEIRES